MDTMNLLSFLNSYLRKTRKNVSSHCECGRTWNTDRSKNEMGEKLGDNLFELRSGIGGNIQRALYFHWLGSKFIITHGFTKKTQKTPIQEIAKAIEIRKEFEEEIKDANS